MSDMLVAATLIMANKIIDTSTFQELWEEIKMLDVLKFAHEKGMEEGKMEGTLETAREMLLKVLKVSIGVVPGYITDEVTSISRLDILKSLVEQAVTCKKIEDFEKMLKLANRKP